MTNYEKYKIQIEKFTRLSVDFALDKHTKEIVKCAKFNCKNCVFGNVNASCSENKINWADEEYIELEIDWTKVPIDTKILVRDNLVGKWKPRHFAKYENKEVYAFCDGSTSWSGDGSTMSWEYAKLAKE